MHMSRTLASLFPLRLTCRLEKQVHLCSYYFNFLMHIHIHSLCLTPRHHLWRSRSRGIARPPSPLPPPSHPATTPLVPMHVCMCRTKHLLSLCSFLTVLCYAYCINFSLYLWEGKILCMRPSLAWTYIGAHWHTYVGAYMVNNEYSD